MSCGEIVFKILELILSGFGLLVASVVAYFAYQAFKSQSDQLETLKAQRKDDQEAFKMAQAEFSASQPTLVQIRMKNCPRFQIGALQSGETVSHIIFSGHSTHDQPLHIKVSNIISKRDIPAIQKGEKLGPFVNYSCLLLSNLNPNADLEQWEYEISGERPDFTVLFGKIKKYVMPIGGGSMERDALPDSWGLLLTGRRDQEISLKEFRIRIHFETKTGWQDCHEYRIWPEYASCKRTDPPMMPSYKDPYLDEQAAQEQVT